jgi:hypothetical protein
VTAALAALAVWIEEQLGDETTSRQWIAESAASQVREMASRMAPACRDVPLPWSLTVRQALIEAIRYREEKLSGDPATLDQIALYTTAARQLGIDLGPGGRWRPLTSTEMAARQAAAATSVLPDGSAVLAAADLLQVLGALADAAAFHEERAAAYCDACRVHPAELCDEHAGNLEAAAAYRAVAVRLGDDR